ncbi:MAG: M23 family metallopeptidase [Polyangiaceae bacterium]
MERARTQVEDYRGRGLTYDSHNGTDFAIPPGTPVLAPAPARVVRISTEFHRGGLKVVLDHGSALLTGHAHLSRVLVEEGAVLRRGEMFALSGMSGLDGFVAFPWLAPHVHFNVWLGEDYVDPFPHHGAASLFRGGSPVPYDPATFDRSVDANPESTDWDHEAVEEVLAGCLDPETRARLDSRKDPMVRAGSLFMERSYFPGRFGSTRPLARTVRARAPHLDLPFSIDTFDGVVLADEV